MSSIIRGYTYSLSPHNDPFDRVYYGSLFAAWVDLVFSLLFRFLISEACVSVHLIRIPWLQYLDPKRTILDRSFFFAVFLFDLLWRYLTQVPGKFGVFRERGSEWQFGIFWVLFFSFFILKNFPKNSMWFSGKFFERPDQIRNYSVMSLFSPVVFPGL